MSHLARPTIEQAAFLVIAHATCIGDVRCKQTFTVCQFDDPQDIVMKSHYYARFSQLIRLYGHHFWASSRLMLAFDNFDRERMRVCWFTESCEYLTGICGHSLEKQLSTTTRDEQSLPSTLQNPPIKNLVPPGLCQFNEDPMHVPLLKIFPVSESCAVFRFALPDRSKALNLSTCACILAHAEIGGEKVARPYTPISTNANLGFFDLLVRNYGPTAKMSHTLHELLPGNETIAFSHGPANVKIQASSFIHGQYDHIGMLVGGTGITPMIQALHAILGTIDIHTKVTMLYGSRTSKDILGKEMLHQWAEEYKDRFNLIDVLSQEPAESPWNEGIRGRVDKKLIETCFPSPRDKKVKQIVFVCGPPQMYEALCGPRQETDRVSGALADLGYEAKQVFKF